MKKIQKSKIAKIIFLSIIIALTVYVYFSFPILVMPDSAEYYTYLNIFSGKENFSTWNVVRGPGLPTVLYLITIIFTNSNMGLVIGTFIFYLFLVISTIFIIRNITFKNKVQEKIAYLLCGIFIIFNPIIIGYMHTLLTEFVAIPVLTVYSILALVWINNNKKVVKIILPIIMAISCVFMWFLKQPYVFLVLAPVIISGIISICEEKKIKNILYRIGIISLCIITILLSNILWNFVLKKQQVETDTGRDTTSLLKSAIINGNTAFSVDFYEEHYSMEYITNSNLIEQEDKEEIAKIMQGKSKYKSYKLVNVFNDFRSREEENIERKIAMFSTSEEYTTVDSIKMFFKNIIKYPAKSILAYGLNYGAIADVVPSVRHKDANEYYPSLTDGFYFENKSIGCGIYLSDTNMLWLDETNYLYHNVANLKKDISIKSNLRTFINKTFTLYNKTYSLVIIILPITLIALIIKRKNTKEIKNRKILDLGIILIASSLIHMLFHTVTGAIIDRYGIVVLPGTILGTLILLFDSKEKDGIVMKEKYLSKTDKTLTIIPAYNEGQNIQKVIDELRKDFSNTDILVINDSSKDNTKDIVVLNKVNCITTVFNLNYAYAVQTGIKYAEKYNYDYCIMFDGDGQHIASEAKKLLETIKEKNCDIVIGSRYLEKESYNAPKLRKIGTSFFTKLIKLCTHEKISDPLSGFQVINKRVIKKYAKMGEYPEFPDANLIIEMLLDGYKIEEVSVKMRNREFGESMHGGIIKPIKYMIVMLYTIVLIVLNRVFRRRK